jgi:integrase/recombinase XerD
LRANELGGMRISDIDRDNRRVLIRNVKGKGENQRYVRLGRNSYEALRRWLQVRYTDAPLANDRVWVSIRRQPMSYQAVWHVIKRLGDYNGIVVSPHILRHTAATELYRDTKDILLVMNFLGHTKVEITQRYLRQFNIEFETSAWRTPDEWLAS